jgi:signal transduction histidine kinase
VAALRRKDEFLATVAHELRNSLAPLRTSVAILKMAKLDDPMLARARGILDRRLETVGRLTDNLMDASRIARGKFSMCTEDTSLNAILSPPTAKPPASR